MNEKTKKLVNALIDYFEKPYQKELNIKLRYIDEEELKAYRNENGTTKEG